MSKLSDARATMREFLADMAALSPYSDLDQKNELNQAFVLARVQAKKAAVAYIDALGSE